MHQYEMGWLGYPTTDEIVHADGVGRRQEFQNGAVYVAFTNAIGSAIKNGPIRDKWNTVGGSEPGGSLLGYITGDEIPLPDNQGRMARFENGVIYWHPTYGAWMIRGGILNQWEFIGYEGGTLGYPASDEYVDNGVIKQLFANHLLEFGENEPDPTTPLSRASGDAIDFYTGDSFRLGGVAGILEIRRNAPQDDSRKLAWGFSVSSLAINRAQYGLSTLKDCTSVITSKSKGIHFKDTSPNHKNMLITHMYHISVPNHDDNRRYSLTISCGFHNKTQNLNGNGTLAYGYTMASINRDYYFRIR
ncbi:LGFP repeat-containing protein [Rhodococcus qingshengii]|uniref:LGFP repeat-containing protein n=1 Tax=Rhodococcus qingshengii TaxID=334542 RepID=UPI0035FB199F